MRNEKCEMSKISEIDKNFAVKDRVNNTELCFYDARLSPFEISGVITENNQFRRIPNAVAASVSEGVASLNAHTAGGRLRFSTDSAIIAIRAKAGKSLMPHMPFTGSSCFDLYDGTRYAGTFISEPSRPYCYDALITLPRCGMRNICINFPLYDSVDSLQIGILPDSKLTPPAPYRDALPVLYYGSSITQGGCASRPGNCYQAIISRRFNCDYRILGWSGNAKGEQTMAEYIAKQPMRLFFMDYDHNAESPEKLRATHEKFFLTIREQNPDLPVIFATKTDIPRSPEDAEDFKRRREIVRATYENALRRSDKNVRFIDGSTVFKNAAALLAAADSCTVDGCHPNDLGFACMAKAFGDSIADILGW